MFRWGILSTAKIAREVVVPAHLESENGIVAAVASRAIDKAQAFAARFQIPNAFGSYEEMLASDAIDGVYIPLPTSQHIEWSIKAADAGKHVLCEKPISLDAADIARLKEASDRNQVLIAEAFMVHYHPQWAKIRALIQAGEIGRLRHVQGSFTYFNVDAANMRNQVALGGGALPDIGVYPTVTTRIATGTEPVRVQARVDFDENFGTDCYSSVRADFGEFELSFYVSTQMALRQSMVFHGTEGFIEVSAPFNANQYDHASFHVYNTGHTAAREYRFAGVNQYRLQAEQFAIAATGGEASVFSLDDSTANQKLIDAIYRAGKHGGWEAI